MRSLLMHAVVYVVGNTLFVFGWVMTRGSLDELRARFESPAELLDAEFWPIYPMVLWGGLLLVHLAWALTALLPGSRRRRAAREERQRRRRADDERQRRRDEREADKAARREARRVEAEAKRAEAERRAAEARLAETEARRAAAEPRRRWAVVMFTDISRSTPLTEQLGDEAWAELLTDHRTIVRQTLAHHDGDEVGTQGDGFLVRFDSPDAAVECAVELQETLASRRDAGSFAPHVRVGIHAGEAIHEDEDLVGQVVNLASRVVDVAADGEILITEPVADHLRPGRNLTDRGLHDLKGISRPRHLLSVPWDGAELIVLDEVRDRSAD